MAKQEQNIYGIHAVREALRAGREMDRVLVKRGASSGALGELAGELRQKGIPVQQVPVEKLNRITRRNHQGVIALLSMISYADVTTLLPAIYESGEDPLILLLDGVSDVRNFGAIARSAECAGVHAIVIPESGSAAVNPDAIKTSAGALHRIPVCRHRDLEDVLRFLRESGLRVFAATEKAGTSLYDADLRGPAALVMGSEGTGISHALLKTADQLVSIPMKGTISSLNVSVAAGVLLFEFVRQRRAGSS
jgi:23S rRNA (guanosine2251-2'-O)-methyltransferase